MALFMLWSHNVGEARYERCVTSLDMAQSWLSYIAFLPTFNLHWGIGKYFLSLPNLSP